MRNARVDAWTSRCGQIRNSCAEGIEDSGQLGVTFSYRTNSWNDSNKFILTIAYQLTTRYPIYQGMADAIIVNDFSSSRHRLVPNSKNFS